MKARLKRVPVSPEALVTILQNGTKWLVHKGIPKGSVLKGMTIDCYDNMLFLFIEHEDFEEVDVTHEIMPELSTEFKRL